MAKYTDLITSEHAKRPKFVAKIELSTQAQLDQQSVLASLLTKFDLDSAVGQQLDIIGEWIGATRNVAVPIPGVFFSWDTPGVGWDQGVWKGPFDPTDGVTVLDDGSYRLLLRAKIGSNYWDGTLPVAKQIYDLLFPAGNIEVSDNQDMTVTVTATGFLSAIEEALLVRGYLGLKPAGVKVDYVV